MIVLPIINLVHPRPRCQYAHTVGPYRVYLYAHGHTPSPSLLIDICML